MMGLLDPTESPLVQLGSGKQPCQSEQGPNTAIHLLSPIHQLIHFKALRIQKSQKPTFLYFTKSQTLQYRSQQRPPTRVVVDKEGRTTGTTRPYLNPRLNWYATRVLISPKSLTERIQTLQSKFLTYPHWQNAKHKYWLLESLTHSDPERCWKYITDGQNSSYIEKPQLLTLLEGMFKIHSQLQMPIPTLDTILDHIQKTTLTYKQEKIKMDTYADRFSTGDMASVDPRLYSILIHALILILSSLLEP